MTRDEAKDFMWIENDKNPTIIRWQHHSTISGLVSNLIDKIFDEHEKEKEHWILHCDGLVSAHKHQCEAYEAQLKAKNKEIERLKELIRRYESDE